MNIRVFTTIFTFFLASRSLCNPIDLAKNISDIAKTIPYWVEHESITIESVLDSLRSQRNQLSKISYPIPEDIIRISRSRNTGIGSIRSLQCFVARQPEKWCDADVEIFGETHPAVVGSQWLSKSVGLRRPVSCQETRKRFAKLKSYQQSLYKLLEKLSALLAGGVPTANELKVFSREIIEIQGNIDMIYPKEWRNAKRMVEFKFALEPIIGDLYHSSPGYWVVEHADVFYQRVGTQEVNEGFPDYEFTVGNIDKDGVLYLQRFTDIFTGCWDNSTVVGVELKVKSIALWMARKEFQIRTYLLGIDNQES